ncbi:hypothetical protein J010_06585 [Cryptococcus neoformans]|nr:hypothetical protein C355_06599 [Cryptococcus neoformans var. grubii Th84]OXH00749.1 hypothetical protein J010_06585 [Cryptococcus neoformans var. grubii]OXH22464.1 hypothetical protein J009_06573 [Cryptococcus neoformans var. grubii]OXH42607.1 hypothetical protein J004_06608 [Cryptococcus neoformans var. grubii]OXH43106.1 hypothetical protein J003_06571 [Cryptococcus neoformans var. grubii]
MQPAHIIDQKHQLPQNRFRLPNSHPPFMSMHYHPALAISGRASSPPPLFHTIPKPTLPPRTIGNKPRPNLTIKLGTAGSKSIICQAPFERKSKHHKLHNQLKRQPSLTTIPEQFEESVSSLPPLSHTSSSSQLLPSFELVTPVLSVFSSLFTKDDEKKRSQQGWWSWLSWSSSNKEATRITIEDLLGPAITITSPKATPSPSSDSSDQFGSNEPFFPDFGCDKGSDCGSDSDSETELSTWSGIIPRDVFYGKTWVAGSGLLRTVNGQIVYEPQEKSLLDNISQETKMVRKKRLRSWMENSDLTVRTHEYFVKSAHPSSHYTISINTSTASGSFTAETRTDLLRSALQHAMDLLSLEAMGGSYTE